MEIKVAETLNDVPLERLSEWALYAKDLENLEDLHNKIEFRLAVVKIFSGMTTYEIIKNRSAVINKAYEHCMKILSVYEPKEPEGVIDIDGKLFIYDKEIHNISTAQVIDIKLIEEPYTHPYEIMSTLYIEEGMIYNEEDKGNRVLNPISKRVELFKDAPIGEEWLNLLGFFLRDYIILKAAILGKTKRKSKRILKRAAKEIKTANGSIGQQT